MELTYIVSQAIHKKTKPLLDIMQFFLLLLTLLLLSNYAI